ncbi:MAG: hypothetical protein FWD99_01245 [Oscillospiraceae bacterium]|nr:hypothetical protein [Oscillospiraceae bacterium]
MANYRPNFEKMYFIQVRALEKAIRTLQVSQGQIGRTICMLQAAQAQAEQLYIDAEPSVVTLSFLRDGEKREDEAATEK